MKKNKALLIAVLGFTVLLGGAYALYGNLSANVEREKLAVQESESRMQQVSAQKTDEEKQTAQSVQHTQVKKQYGAPDFTVYDAEGNEVQLYDFMGKPVVLNFWASWCGPCQIEMPDFHEAHAELGDEIQFLMINLTQGRETQENAMVFLEEKGYDFPVFYDLSGEAAANYSVFSLPTTYFINAEGDIIANARGTIDRGTLQEGIDLITAN